LIAIAVCEASAQSAARRDDGVDPVAPNPQPDLAGRGAPGAAKEIVVGRPRRNR
jgi:hypothetical protein